MTRISDQHSVVLDPINDWQILGWENLLLKIKDTEENSKSGKSMTAML